VVRSTHLKEAKATWGNKKDLKKKLPQKENSVKCPLALVEEEGTKRGGFRRNKEMGRAIQKVPQPYLFLKGKQKRQGG